MTDIEALITIARRYCIDNNKYWMDRYSKELSGNNNPYSDNDYDLFPRYNALTAILQGVEIIVGQDFSSMDDCKDELKKLGLISQSRFTEGKHNPIESKAIQEERNKFVDLIESINAIDIKKVEPLPYKRRLSEIEAKEVRRQFEMNLGYDGSYWNPLNEKSKIETIFLMKENLLESDQNKIIDFIKSHAEKRLFEIKEDMLDYELEIDSLDIDCYETIYSDMSFKWAIYGSHESTVAFGGTELVKFVKQLFGDRVEEINKWI